MSLMPYTSLWYFFILLLVSSLSILAFRYSFFLFLKYLLASCLTLFRLCTLLWFGTCNNYILAYFLLSKNCEHYSSNHGLCCFNSYRPRSSLVEVLLCQALFMSLLSFKFSKVANLFVILIWHCFLTSSSFSDLRLNLSTTNTCAESLFTANISPTFATTR